MADSKYANLPGIDTSSKDVYESGDLPEEDQNWKPEELNSSSVEIFKVGTQQAFDHFNEKYVSGDFNFQALSSGRTKGYSSVDQSETMLQKYNRLKMEIEALLLESESVHDAKSNNDSNFSSLMGKVQNLEAQLKTSNLKSFSEEEFTFDKSENVMNALSTATTDAQKSKAALKDGSYKVYLKPDSNQKQLKRISMLEQRLATLENILGNESDRSNILASHSKSVTLRECIQLMETKLTLLDHEKLPEVDTRLQAILTKVNEINKAFKNDSAVDTNKKISELYETIRKWDQVQSALPHILTRLKDTEALHKKACEFSSTLLDLETAQSQITSRLDSSLVCQEELKQMFKKNVDIIESNISQLSKRMSELDTNA